jgi:hypothetical protein
MVSMFRGSFFACILGVPMPLSEINSPQMQEEGLPKETLFLIGRDDRI